MELGCPAPIAATLEVALPFAVHRLVANLPPFQSLIRVARFAVQQAADDPQHPRCHHPTHYTLEVPAQWMRGAQRPSDGDERESGTPYLDGHVAGVEEAGMEGAMVTLGNPS